MTGKAQVSMEYMLIVGITTIVAITLVGISYYYSHQVEDTVNTNQLDQIAKEIVDNAESMYYFGEPSKTTIKVFIPDGIQSARIGPNEISFTIRTDAGNAEVFTKSAVTLQGSLSTSYGYHYITIEAKGGYVWINST